MEGNVTSDVDCPESKPLLWSRKVTTRSIPDSIVRHGAPSGDLGHQVILSQNASSVNGHHRNLNYQIGNGLGLDSDLDVLPRQLSAMSQRDTVLNHCQPSNVGKDHYNPLEVYSNVQNGINTKDFPTPQTCGELSNITEDKTVPVSDFVPVKEVQYSLTVSSDTRVLEAETVQKEEHAVVSNVLNESMYNNQGKSVIESSLSEKDTSLNVSDNDNAQNLEEKVRKEQSGLEKHIRESFAKDENVIQENNGNDMCVNDAGGGKYLDEMNGNIIDSTDLSTTTDPPADPPEGVSTVKRKRGRPRREAAIDATKLSSLPVKRTRSVGNNFSYDESEQNEEHGGENETCLWCGDTFQWQSQLSEHQLTCPFINQLGSTIKTLTYNCPICKIVCTRKHGLKRHLLRKHPKANSFTCIFCHMQIGPMQDFLQHVHAHLRSIASLRKHQDIGLKQPSPKTKTSNEVECLPESEFICIECNMSVKNDHSLVLHMLGHKINETLKVVCDKDSEQTEVKGENQPYTALITPSTVVDGSSLQPSMPECQSTSQLPDGFSFLSAELTSTINRSFHCMTFLLQRIHSELNWTDAKGPNTNEDLITKFKALSTMSSGITDVSNCLAQLLTKGGQHSDNPLAGNEEEEHNSNRKCEQKDGDNNDEDDDENVNDENDEFNISSEEMVSKTCTKKKNKRKKSKKKYVCNVCGKEIAYASSFSRHKKIHEGSKSYECQICSKQFRRNHQLQRHYNTHSLAGKFKCNLCDYSVKTISVFLKHMVDVHNKGKEMKGNIDNVSCHSELENDGCGNENQTDNLDETTKNESKVLENDDKEDEGMGVSCEENVAHHLKRRMVTKKITKMKKRYICTDCGAELAHYSSYMRHKMIHQNKKPYQCQVCSKSFRRKHQLQRHGMVHSKKGKKYKCELCDFTTNTRAALEKHSFEHDSDRLYSCEVCEHRTRTTHELSQHKKSHEPRTCKYCDYHAENLSDLRIHERKSHLTLSCKQCDYACFSNWQLQRHLKTHNKDTKELYFCELCGFSCNTKRQFTYHMLRHTNRTPFSCPDCDYKCSSRSSLAAHKLMHAGLKPFLCSFCGLSFRRSSHLNNHLLIHKDEKQFVCRTCGHPFRTRHNLKVHEMIHTGEKQHKCHLCPFACRRNKELRLHLEKHGVIMERADLLIVPKEELKF